MTPTDTLEVQAHDILKSLTDGLDHPLGIGSFSVTIYDTAWVAMVEKVNERTGERQWLFPQCFQFLLDNQLSDGTWESYSCNLDGILNSMAALLALKKRSASLKAPSKDLDDRCIRAQGAIQQLLKKWDTASCDRVGFEVIVPSLFRLLQEAGVELDFPDRDALTRLSDSKTSKLYPLLYNETQSTLTHSLEAFAGRLDYDKVKHHTTPYGAMLASPSSTAAYLIYSKEWDDRAENYLRQVVNIKGRNGGLPSAFPTTIFELSWATTTLIEAGFTQEELGASQLAKVAAIMSDNLDQQNGVVGFAPHCLPDADDSAFAISMLGFLDQHVPLDRLFAKYETTSHFLTYHGERNASFSANCNVLLCLLRRPDVSKHTSKVVKCTQFLNKLWSDGKVKDKWNTSDHYSMMLLAKAFVLLLARWEQGELTDTDLPHGLVSERVPIVLIDILIRTLDRQSLDGSWDYLNEVTAYALITLATLSRLPWFQSVESEITKRMAQARGFLAKNRDFWSNAEYLWIEKVAYSSSNLSQTYCLAAMKATERREGNSTLGNQVKGLVQGSSKMAKFFTMLPTFAQTPLWKLEIIVAQAALFVPALARTRLDIFSRKGVGTDKYLQYIPFTWVSIGNGSVDLPLGVGWEMMILSMLIYQVDEFVEAFIAHDLPNNLEDVRQIVRRRCAFSTEVSGNKRPRGNSIDTDGPASKLRIGKLGDTNGNGTTNGHKNGNLQVASTLQEVDGVFGQFIDYVRNHPKVARSAPWLQQWLCQELQGFLLSHLAHTADCHALARESNKPGDPLVYKTAGYTYFDWVRTISADTTGGAFAFPFYMCLLELPSKSMLNNPVVRYIAEDASRHLSTLCRQHNDIGSLKRDLAEKNLNSVNFDEFNINTNSDWETTAKKELHAVADYERTCLDKSLADLERLVDPKLSSYVNVFVKVTDLYGQIYLAKDVSATNQKSTLVNK